MGMAKGGASNKARDPIRMFQFPMGMAKVSYGKYNQRQCWSFNSLWEWQKIEWGCSLMEPKVSIPYGNGKRARVCFLGGYDPFQFPMGMAKEYNSAGIEKVMSFQFPMGMAKVNNTEGRNRRYGVSIPYGNGKRWHRGSPTSVPDCFNSLWKWQKLDAKFNAMVNAFQFPMGMAKATAEPTTAPTAERFNSLWEWQKSTG